MGKSYIPKKAQRLIEGCRKSTQEALANKPISMKRTRLSIHEHPVAVLKRYDVYFNGEKQSLCVVADAELNYITRYKYSIEDGQVETLHGIVEIVLKTKPINGKTLCQQKTISKLIKT